MNRVITKGEYTFIEYNILVSGAGVLFIVSPDHRANPSYYYGFTHPRTHGFLWWKRRDMTVQEALQAAVKDFHQREKAEAKRLADLDACQELVKNLTVVKYNG